MGILLQTVGKWSSIEMGILESDWAPEAALVAGPNEFQQQVHSDPGVSYRGNNLRIPIGPPNQLNKSNVLFSFLIQKHSRETLAARFAAMPESLSGLQAMPVGFGLSAKPGSH